MTIYLVFPDHQTACDQIELAGYRLTEWRDHFDGGIGWGAILPDPNSTDFLANIYLCDECPESLLGYQIPTPKNPLNVVAL